MKESRHWVPHHRAGPEGTARSGLKRFDSYVCLSPRTTCKSHSITCRRGWTRSRNCKPKPPPSSKPCCPPFWTRHFEGNCSAGRLVPKGCRELGVGSRKWGNWKIGNRNSKMETRKWAIENRQSKIQNEVWGIKEWITQPPV